MPAAEATAGIEAVLLTHTHVDHLDAAGVTTVPAGIPWFCQPEDLGDLQPIGLQVRPVPAGRRRRLGGPRHRAHRRARTAAPRRSSAGSAPVSGFVVRADGEPTLYVAGDTVWCDEVADAVAAHDPDVIVVNAGAATFLNGGTVTMEAADVVAVAEAAPRARSWPCTWRRSTTASRPARPSRPRSRTPGSPSAC